MKAKIIKGEKRWKHYPDATNGVLSKKLKYFWKINPDISNGATSDLLE